MKLGNQNSETVKKEVHSSDVICFSGIKDSGKALLLRLMRAFLSLLCSLERDYTGFSTDLPLSLCKTAKLWQVQGLGGGVCPIVAGLWQVCKTGTQCDELWSSALRALFFWPVCRWYPACFLKPHGNNRHWNQEIHSSFFLLSKGRFVFVDLSIITRVNSNKDFEGRTSSYCCASIVKGQNSLLIS